MKNEVSIFFACSLFAALTPSNANGAPSPATPEVAKAEAIKRYPELGKEGSKFNKTFITRVAEYRKTSPAIFGDASWPLEIAEEVAADLTNNAKDALKLTQQPDPQRGKGASDKAVRVFLLNRSTTRRINAEVKVTFSDHPPVTSSGTLPPSFLGTYSFFTTSKNVTGVEILSATFTDKPIKTLEVPDFSAPKAKAQYGLPVEGKPGFVTSPYSPTADPIDVRGLPKDTETRDPNSGKTFLVPSFP